MAIFNKSSKARESPIRKKLEKPIPLEDLMHVVLNFQRNAQNVAYVCTDNPFLHERLIFANRKELEEQFAKLGLTSDVVDFSFNPNISGYKQRSFGPIPIDPELPSEKAARLKTRA